VKQSHSLPCINETNPNLISKNMDEQIILVDENDSVIGVGEKIKAHLDGQLHRAFSIFIFNSSGELLLQKRARAKYHSGALWSNTCCSHPRPSESTMNAAHRRLNEEMGFDCKLVEIFKVVYKVKVDECFLEHEYDHILIGQFEGEPAPDFNEIEDWKWVTVSELKEDMERTSKDYTLWLIILIDKVLAHVFHSDVAPKISTRFSGPTAKECYE
jgi:isopentenyl-diphosphate Delta-isomerase